MNDKEIKEALSALESKMTEYATKSSVLLTGDDIQLMKQVYPEFNQLTGGQSPTLFNTGCSSCIKQVLSIYIGFYFREKEVVIKTETIEPVAFNEVKDGND